MKEALMKLETTIKKLSLTVNVNKTKYMRVGGTEEKLEYIEAGQFRFE